MLQENRAEDIEFGDEKGNKHVNSVLSVEEWGDRPTWVCGRSITYETHKNHGSGTGHCDQQQRQQQNNNINNHHSVLKHERASLTTQWPTTNTSTKWEPHKQIISEQKRCISNCTLPQITQIIKTVTQTELQWTNCVDKSCFKVLICFLNIPISRRTEFAACSTYSAMGNFCV